MEWLQKRNVSADKFIPLKDLKLSLFEDKEYGKLQTILIQIKKWLQLRKTISESSALGYKIEIVLLPYIDSFYLPGIFRFILKFIFPYPWICVCIRPPHDNRKNKVMEIFNNTHSIFLSNYCKAIGLLEEDLVFGGNDQSGYKHKLVLFPDFAEEEVFQKPYDIVQEIRQKAGKRRTIGTLGSLCKRKGILALLKVAERSMTKPWYFIFAGQFAGYSFTKDENKYIADFIASARENCYFHLYQIPDEPHFNAILSTCDILTLLYENFPFSSNFFSKAALFHKLVIGTGSYCIGNRISKYQFGVTAGCNDIQRIITSIDYLTLNYDTLIKSAKFEEYLRLHSKQNIGTCLEEMLKRANEF
jgi:glycosyltransferase involved in cell wall biosynthesis